MDEKKQKYVRGCIVGPDIAVLSLAIVKQGEAGVCTFLFKYLAVSRSKAGNEMFNLSKEDDVRKYVVRREVKSGKENAKPYMGPAAPKIQRLVTPIRLLRCCHLRSVKLQAPKLEHQKEQKSEYDPLKTFHC
ncbi:hypothetical protein EV421DRAFT_2090723 [Armillaria borealis]|uniref:Uncharacterized protein n=1 Tax=Armillaria borealis TaxID=47425 RepID=A0AA39MD88_9AGAR|nr:hypothetical protein EV421DRAFT_2090723 [Armillaria borealis]